MFFKGRWGLLFWREEDSEALSAGRESPMELYVVCKIKHVLQRGMGVKLLGKRKGRGGERRGGIFLDLYLYCVFIDGLLAIGRY